MADIRLRFDGQADTAPAANLVDDMAIEEKPLIRGDRLRFGLRHRSQPNPLPESVTLEIDSVNFGKWVLSDCTLDVATGIATYTGKRLADAQTLADRVGAIMAQEYTLSPLTTALPATHLRWNTILGGVVTTPDSEGQILPPPPTLSVVLLNWIYRRLARKQDRPTLETFERELPKYGFTLALGNIAPFTDGVVSVIPLNYTTPLAQGATTKTIKSSATGNRKLALAPPLSRQLSFTATGVEYRGGDGGFQLNLGQQPTLGEGVVVLEMRRYYDMFQSDVREVEIPFDADYLLRDKVVYQGNDYIVAGVTHGLIRTARTKLTLQRLHAPTATQISAGSPPPYNSSALRYDSPPGQATITAHFQLTAPDPFPSAPALAGKSIDWKLIGGGVGLNIAPPATGLPLTKYEISIVRSGLIDGVQYQNNQTIANPPSNAPVPIVLADQPAGLYTASVRAFNAFGDSGNYVLGVSHISFNLTAATPAKPDFTPIVDEDLERLSGLTPEQQDAVLEQSRISG